MSARLPGGFMKITQSPAMGIFPVGSWKSATATNNSSRLPLHAWSIHGLLNGRRSHRSPRPMSGRVRDMSGRPNKPLSFIPASSEFPAHSMGSGG
ncbi:hypothetical protein AZA_00585 [Nitrospirillum viridazoti Y2]|nr:hypothetical protein AZA_00585 [Nitrospirillum amazonense Y2]